MGTDQLFDSTHLAEGVLGVVTTLYAETHADAAPPGSVNLDSQLERDLGFDSLARAELFNRIEQTLHVRAPLDAFSTALTPAELVQAIKRSEAPAASGGEQPSIAQRAQAPASVLTEEPREATTLIEVLQWHVDRHPQRSHIVFLEDGMTPAELSYGDLDRRAAAAASGLRRHGIGPGDTVALMLATGWDYFVSFVAILMSGAVPVPIYPPARVSQIEEHVRRHAAVLSNAGAKALIASPEVAGVGRLLKLHVPALQQVLTAAQIGVDRNETSVPLAASDIALLQYTSGSTGDPKGVMLTHANLLANIRAMGARMQVTSADVLVSWLPLYHDMGLIGAWFGPMYFGMPLVVMPPTVFLARPERWLRLIQRYRGTLTAAPNFAYAHCAQHLDEAILAGLDLSSLRFAFCGAEPVSAATVRAFAARFGHYGFDARAVTPVYGLAENTLGLSFPRPGRGLHVDRVQRDALGATGQALPARSDADAIEVVGCGEALDSVEIRIVDEDGREQPQRQVGRIEFRGPSATMGYFHNPAQTARLIHDGWLDTGDLGYLADGELFITGRAKDLIIRGGHHIFPYELEEAIGRLPGIPAGGVAVCGSTDRASGTERVVILAETALTQAAAREQLLARVRATAVEILGAPAEHVCLVTPDTILKTPSGKIRHAATLDQFERGGRPSPASPVWRQFASVLVGALLPFLRRIARQASHAAYGFYCWTVLGMLSPLIGTVFLSVDTPRNWRRAAAVGRLFLRLTGLRVDVEIDARSAAMRELVMVANHSSYLDGLILLAVLPQPVRFVAKRGLDRHWLAGRFLRAIGTSFVERREYRGSVDDERRLVQQADGDSPLLFFPEGTFGRGAGLRPFHLGAFRVACAAGRAVVPVALAGVRAVLPDGVWLPRLGSIKVAILPPIVPDGSDLGAMARLREAARNAILARCGEPSLIAHPIDKTAQEHDNEHDFASTVS
ncbi:AMP-binding protein [Paraburkholderia sp. MM5384-R2]|uniref:AMP-binding protein n=1 Tax=Paraburkholderia sp. MM5384-R2 TaxID=2723097 RepID=UPI0017930177|nr:AMP-binding protein [Paraburkholderia sp. MM5384-R2]MBB5495981.1 1-acyl-sn-glycerol-3-phosphate acyltransferase [Paraburkholderia sp. MM5384-R2]